MIIDYQLHFPEAFPNTPVTTMGHGLSQVEDAFSPQRLQRIARFISGTTIPNARCEELLQDSVQGEASYDGRLVEDSMVCAESSDTQQVCEASTRHAECDSKKSALMR